MTTFDYFGEFYYLHNQQIIKRNIIKKAYETNSYKFNSERCHDAVYNNAMGCADKKIILVGRTKDGKYTKITFTKGLEMIEEKYKIKDMSTDANCFLKKHAVINHGMGSLITKYGEDVRYPRNFSGSCQCFKESHSSFGIGCYDRYKDRLVSIGSHPGIIYLYVWRKTEDHWNLLKQGIFLDMYAQKKYHVKIDHLECTREHIIVHLFTKSSNDANREESICVLDKKTFKTIDVFKGKCPVYMDDYEGWCEESLEFLSKVEILEKMSISLLRIILSYIA
jgi:hypothetical protein